MNKIKKFTFAVGLALAVTIIFNCSMLESNDPEPSSSSVGISSSSNVAISSSSKVSSSSISDSEEDNFCYNSDGNGDCDGIGVSCSIRSEDDCALIPGAQVMSKTHCENNDYRIFETCMINSSCNFNGYCSNNYTQNDCEEANGNFSNSLCAGSDVYGSCNNISSGYESDCIENVSKHYCETVGGDFSLSEECPIISSCTFEYEESIFGCFNNYSEEGCEEIGGTFSLGYCEETGFGTGECVEAQSYCYNSDGYGECDPMPFFVSESRCNFTPGASVVDLEWCIEHDINYWNCNEN